MRRTRHQPARWSWGLDPLSSRTSPTSRRHASISAQRSGRPRPVTHVRQASARDVEAGEVGWGLGIGPFDHSWRTRGVPWLAQRLDPPCPRGYPLMGVPDGFVCDARDDGKSERTAVLGRRSRDHRQRVVAMPGGVVDDRADHRPVRLGICVVGDGPCQCWHGLRQLDVELLSCAAKERRANAGSLPAPASATVADPSPHGSRVITPHTTLANGDSDPEGCSPLIQLTPTPAVWADGTVSVQGVLFDSGSRRCARRHRLTRSPRSDALAGVRSSVGCRLNGRNGGPRRERTSGSAHRLRRTYPSRLARRREPPTRSVSRRHASPSILGHRRTAGQELPKRL